MALDVCVLLFGKRLDAAINPKIGLPKNFLRGNSAPVGVKGRPGEYVGLGRVVWESRRSGSCSSNVWW